MARDHPSCPKCNNYASFRPHGEGWRCDDCGWRGDVYQCHPLRPDTGPAETARPEDAVCANHPGKRAVAVCAGTGDYICSLCRVKVGDKDFSVQYLDRQGPEMAKALFATKLPRWDRIVELCAGLCLAFFIAAPVLVVVATWALYKGYRERRVNPLYRELAGNVRVWILWFVMVGATVLYFSGLLLLILAPNTR